jgi:hypothetical protein
MDDFDVIAEMTMYPWLDSEYMADFQESYDCLPYDESDFERELIYNEPTDSSHWSY